MSKPTPKEAYAIGQELIRQATPGPWTARVEPDMSSAYIEYCTPGLRSQIATLYAGSLYDEHGGTVAANAALIVQAVNTFDETRAALEAAYANSCHRADTRRKWTARDQSVHEAIKAVLAKMEETP